MPADMMGQLRDEMGAFRERIRTEAQEMRAARRTLGPRVRNRLRRQIMEMPAEQGASTVLKLQEFAGHQDGETGQCPACRFFGEE